MIYIVQWKLLYLTTMFNRNETYPNQNVFRDNSAVAIQRRTCARSLKQTRS